MLEPSKRALLNVVYHSVLFVRLRSEGSQRLSDEHLFDLMDAIHNVPKFVARDDRYFTLSKLRNEEFAAYDKKWGDDGIQLVSLFDRELADEQSN